MLGDRRIHLSLKITCQQNINKLGAVTKTEIFISAYENFKRLIIRYE